MEERGFYAYMLECADGSFYTGWTTDVEKRLSLHNKGKGAKYTRGRGPLKLLATWRFSSKSEAMKFEVWLKKLPRSAKEKFVRQAGRF